VAEIIFVSMGFVGIIKASQRINEGLSPSELRYLQHLKGFRTYFSFSRLIAIYNVSKQLLRLISF